MPDFEERYDRLMHKARATNFKRDQTERQMHLGAVSDLGMFLQLRTAMSAIECGIKTKDWECVAEGQAILEQVHEKVELLPKLFTQSTEEFIAEARRELRAAKADGHDA